MNAHADAMARLPEEWRAVLESAGERGYRADQIFHWIHRHGVFDPAQMTNLPAELRGRLSDLGVAAPAEVAEIHASRDGTRKLVLALAGGARVECVIIPMTPLAEADADLAAGEGDDDEQGAALPDKVRVTLCVSTQFGCAMGCVFCASGQAGLVRALKASEIVSQVLIARRHLEPDEELKNLVFMGMGEPLHHYDETARALRLLTHERGLAMSPRRITVSTVGLVPGIQRLGADFAGKVGLAVSLHAPNDAIRDRIVPMNKKYPLAELMAALRNFPLPKRRRITIEYTLIDAVNDGISEARELARLLRGLPVKINLIPMNLIAASEHHAPESERVQAFREELAALGYSCFVRSRRGDEVAAACGQLAMADELVRLKRQREERAR